MGLIKRLMGRELSEKDIKLAKQGYHYSPFKDGRKKLFASPHEIGMDADEELIIVGYTAYEFARTEDFSISGKYHQQWYQVSNKVKAYTLDGLLIAQEKGENEPAGPAVSFKAKAYNPPGSIMGKKVSREEYQGENSIFQKAKGILHKGWDDYVKNR